ncbi:hypothetical protein NBRC110019_22260 [Neptunitalea chrysea]|uniref:Uncharacterized protein n=1 Tax=Neptunitalea chrysea TaxID=1647581 RepID=A0A9W6B617_9FLAO|nr:hypothetical protein [Neptunitalea chrysea]GLB53186.1 hypothetical protein NBRC110019_22260 [Neptunitalea chrysea]
MLNTSRQFLYNPEYNLTTKEKRGLNGKKINIDKTEKSKAKIKDVLINWNYEKLGKITNKKVSEVTKMNIKTIVRYCTTLINELGVSKTKEHRL